MIYQFIFFYITIPLGHSFMAFPVLGQGMFSFMVVLDVPFVSEKRLPKHKTKLAKNKKSQTKGSSRNS